MDPVIRRADVIGEWSRAPLAILGWLRDGTLLLATSDQDPQDLDWEQGKATPYQKQFSDCPELVQAIDRAYQGERRVETVRLHDSYWDVRLWPMFRGDSLGGVVGILTEATSRITAQRTNQTIQILSAIRYRLARSDSVDDFLGSCCRVIEQFHAGVWIGVADRDEPKTLRIITGTSDETHWFASLNLSWDVARKNGRHPPAEAVRTGRVQIEQDVLSFSEGKAWINSAIPWPSLLAIPLQGNGTLTGVLVIHGDARNTYEAEMARLWEQVAREITEGIELLRVQEERARISRERQGAYQQYQQLLNTIFDIVVVHRGGRVVEINPAGVKLFAAGTAEHLIGTHVLALIDPADRERMKEVLAESSHVETLREFRVLSLEGQAIDVEGLTVSVVHDGTPARLSHWRDISERKRSEHFIRQQKTSLEYAQQVSQSGSIDVDLADGTSEWSPNALAILGIAPEMQPKPFVEAVTSVIAEPDRAEFLRFFEHITAHGKEHHCEVGLKSDDTSNFRCIYLHGIPQLAQHTRVGRVFIVVQDISRHRNAERLLKAKLAATWRLARVAEWTYELDKQVIVFHGDQKSFLGFESPITSITYDQFMGSIREADREEVRRAVARTFRHGSDGEVVYEEQFHEGVRLLLYTRWVPERGEDGKMVRFRGLSLDISRVRDVQGRKERKEQIHVTGLPERDMAYDRLYYLATRAVRLALPFSVIGIRIREYREIKRQMANDALYLQTHHEIAKDIYSLVSNVDTFARLDPGCFIVILSVSASLQDGDRVNGIVSARWQEALEQTDPAVATPIEVKSVVLHCPQDSPDWEALLELLHQQLGRDVQGASAMDQPRGHKK
ncbi:MAG: PAS domain S-box protein [Proteobacteria bacterium]|nr:PAS domain S-box protein [Pseudomonadota bacterium]